MSWGDYYAGISFIKKVAGTPEELAQRLKYWKTNAKPLVGKECCKRAGERVYF